MVQGTVPKCAVLNAPGHAAQAAAVGGAGGVVLRPDGAVLLLRHLEGTWVFPKGHIDPGEDALSAAIREVEEEAGVRSVCPDPTLQETTHYRNACGTQRVITWFLLLTDAQDPVLREVLFPEGGFFTPTEAHTRLSFDEDRRLLEAMLRTMSAHPRLEHYRSRHEASRVRP